MPRRPRRLRAAAERVLRDVAERADVCLAGNHDLARARHDRPRRSSTATPRRRRPGRETCWAGRARRSSTASSPRARPTASRSTTASARDPVWEYVLTRGGRARDARARPTRRSCSSGTATSRCGRPVRRRARRRPRAGRHGSRARRRPVAPQSGIGRSAAGRRPARGVSPARPGARSSASFRRVEYDVERTQREMRDAGLPEMLAARLELGCSRGLGTGKAGERAGRDGDAAGGATAASRSS